MIGNHFSEVIGSRKLRPSGATPVIIKLAEGGNNYIASNRMVALDVRAASGDSAFDALLTTEAAEALNIVTVVVEPSSDTNTILDSGTDAKTILDRIVNAFGPTPGIGS